MKYVIDWRFCRKFGIVLAVVANSILLRPASAQDGSVIVISEMPRPDTLEMDLLANAVYQAQRVNPNVDYYPKIEKAYLWLRPLSTDLKYEALDSPAIPPTEVFSKTFLNCSSNIRKFTYNDEYYEKNDAVFTLENGVTKTDFVKLTANIGGNVGVFSAGVDGEYSNTNVVDITATRKETSTSWIKKTESYTIEIPANSLLTYSRGQNYKTIAEKLSGKILFDLKYQIVFTKSENEDLISRSKLLAEDYTKFSFEDDFDKNNPDEVDDRKSKIQELNSAAAQKNYILMSLAEFDSGVDHNLTEQVDYANSAAKAELQNKGIGDLFRRLVPPVFSPPAKVPDFIPVPGRDLPLPVPPFVPPEVALLTPPVLEALGVTKRTESMDNSVGSFPQTPASEADSKLNTGEIWYSDQNRGIDGRERIYPVLKFDGVVTLTSATNDSVVFTQKPLEACSQGESVATEIYASAFDYDAVREEIFGDHSVAYMSPKLVQSKTSGSCKSAGGSFSFGSFECMAGKVMQCTGEGWIEHLDDSFDCDG